MQKQIAAATARLKPFLAALNAACSAGVRCVSGVYMQEA